MSKTRVVNIRSDKCRENFIYIGRGSKWGNPFSIGKDGTREEVIEKYREWVKTQPELLNSLHELKNMRLGCFCYPQHCHGDVLIELLEEKDDG